MRNTKQNKSEILLIAFLMQLTLYLAQGLIVTAVSDFGRLRYEYMLASVLTVPFVFLLPLWFYCRFSGYRPFRNDFENPNSSHPQRRITFKGLCYFVFAAAAVISAVNLAGMLTDSLLTLFGKPAEHELPSGAAQFALTFIKTVIFAPVFEELLFRGAIFHAFSDRSDRFKILLSASLFALMHYDLLALPYAFGAGLAISYFSVTKRSVKYGLVLHLISNLTTFVFSALAATIEPALYGKVSTVTFWILLAIALAGLAQVFVTSRRGASERSAELPEPFPRELIIYMIFAAIWSVLFI
ncbi:MAG: CPBP family intramembrane metalloprotease [Ruminococcaceae bacterium]|nr:CPBP family intramembrane metalloprotease [Oscillospiraceae bacterium]